MGVFGWLLRKFDEGIVGKEFVEAQRAHIKAIVDEVEAQEDVQFLDELLADLASKQVSAETTLATLFVYFGHEEYGGRISALVQSLPGAEGADWRETLLAISKLRSELAALMVDAILTEAIKQRTDKTEVQQLTDTRERLVQHYRKGEPLRFVEEALNRG